jgi:release factor glutamine methyltransferase
MLLHNPRAVFSTMRHTPSLWKRPVRLTELAPVRSFWRFFLAWRFRLFQRHRHRRLTLEYVDGVPILVLPDVFNPKLFRTGEALVSFLETEPLQPDMAVLDLGTGSGIGAVFAARRGARVVATDLIAEAVRCARINVLLNRVEAWIDVRQGDLFEPVSGERFDLVLFNPPYYRGRPRETWEYAWRSDDVLERFCAGLPDALQPDGRALLILSTDMVGATDTLTRCGLSWRLLWQRDFINERLMVVEVVDGDAHGEEGTRGEGTHKGMPLHEGEVVIGEDRG